MFGRNGSGVAGAAVGQAAAEYAANVLQQPTATETELQYASRVADDALRTLEKLMAELEARLQTVLMQEPPSPATADKQAMRVVTSPIATALLQHAAQTENVVRHAQSLLRRIAI